MRCGRPGSSSQKWQCHFHTKALKNQGVTHQLSLLPSSRAASCEDGWWSPRGSKPGPVALQKGRALSPAHLCGFQPPDLATPSSSMAWLILERLQPPGPPAASPSFSKLLQPPLSWPGLLVAHQCLRHHSSLNTSYPCVCPSCQHGPTLQD